MITHLLKSFLIGILFIDMLERRFPIQFQNFMINISYNSIYYFGKLQIFFGKVKRDIDIFIENNPSLLKIKQKINLLISKSETQQVRRYYVKNSKLYNLSETNSVEPDFMILSWFNTDTKCINKKIIYNKDDDILSAEKSNIKFLLMEIKIGNNNSRKIDLKTDYFDYYLVGNKFTKVFFIFYLKHYLQYYDDIKDSDKITLRIIDHDVNTINLDFTDKNETILLEKNGYKLSITNHNEENE
jgi:hypothetical protein